MLEYWPYATHKKTFFFFTKSGILILNLYLHSIKIQTNIKSFKKCMEKSTIFLRNFRIFLKAKKTFFIFENLGCLDENRVF